MEHRFEAESGILLTATAAVSLPVALGHGRDSAGVLPYCLHWAAPPRITLNAQVAWILADQRECDAGEPGRTEPTESHPAENRKVGGSIPSHHHIDQFRARATESLRWVSRKGPWLLR
jgi:hypothetical protein